MSSSVGDVGGGFRGDYKTDRPDRRIQTDARLVSRHPTPSHDECSQTCHRVMAHRRPHHRDPRTTSNRGDVDPPNRANGNCVSLLGPSLNLVSILLILNDCLPVLRYIGPSNQFIPTVDAWQLGLDILACLLCRSIRQCTVHFDHAILNGPGQC